MQGVAEPTLLVERSILAAELLAKPSHIRAIANAGVFVRVSERLEPFTGKIVRSLPDSVRSRHAGRRARHAAAEPADKRNFRARRA